MKDTIKRHLISFVITFLATFLLILAPAVMAGEWTAAFFLSAVIAAARSAFKVAWELVLIPLLNLLLDYAKKLIKNN